MQYLANFYHVESTFQFDTQANELFQIVLIIYTKYSCTFEEKNIDVVSIMIYGIIKQMKFHLLINI